MAVSEIALAAKRSLATRLLADSASNRTGGAGRVSVLRARQASAEPGMAVHAVGVGTDTATGEARLNVYITIESLAAATEKSLNLPAEQNGLPVHILVAPMARASNCSQLRQQHQRPVKPGISAGHKNITTGTIGALVRRAADGKVYLLSNNHVFANTNRAIIGDEIYQPGPIDLGRSADTIAKLAEFVPIALSQTANNQVDAAIAEPIEAVPIDPMICILGAVKGTKKAVQNMGVYKHGRTTGETWGYVTDESIDVMVDMSDFPGQGLIARFEDQIRIQGHFGAAFGLGGDSGSLVLERDTNAAVGLYFAGPDDGSYGLANPIDVVMTRLGLNAIL